MLLLMVQPLALLGGVTISGRECSPPARFSRRHSDGSWNVPAQMPCRSAFAVSYVFT
jgi:hypothetical protein